MPTLICGHMSCFPWNLILPSKKRLPSKKICQWSMGRHALPRRRRQRSRLQRQRRKTSFFSICSLCALSSGRETGIIPSCVLPGQALYRRSESGHSGAFRGASALCHSRQRQDSRSDRACRLDDSLRDSCGKHPDHDLWQESCRTHGGCVSGAIPVLFGAVLLHHPQFCYRIIRQAEAEGLIKKYRLIVDEEDDPVPEAMDGETANAWIVDESPDEVPSGRTKREDKKKGNRYANPRSPIYLLEKILTKLEYCKNSPKPGPSPSRQLLSSAA